MNFDFERLEQAARYKLLCALVVPRPIALVTTANEDGSDNAAPFSFFNVFSEEPPLVILGLQSKGPGKLKDTALNIERSGEFVVNLVDEAIAERMNLCAVDFPAGVSEVEEAGFTTAPGEAVAVRRIVEAPASFECRRYVTLQLGETRHLAVGQVLRLHVRDGLIDPETLYLDTARYAPVGRLHGNLYTRTREHFEMVRLTYDEWLAEAGRQPKPAS